MNDLTADMDGTIADAGDRINSLFAGSGPPDPPPTPALVGEKPRDPETGRFLSAKPREEGEEAPPAALNAAETDEQAPAEGEDAPKDETPPEDAPKAPAPTYKVKVDGIEQELPLDEIAKGYSRTADYTRKTQALAEERKRFEAEEVAPIREERRLYAERLAQLDEIVRFNMPDQEPDWVTLRNTLTPDQFGEAFANWQANAQRLGKIRSERDRLAQAEAQDADRRLQARLQEEHQKLQAAIPEFADPDKGKQLKEDLVAYAKSLHFSDDDLAQVTDHRVLVLLNKARQYDEAQLRKPKIEAKIDRVLDTAKPSATKSAPKKSDLEVAKARLKQSGRVDDAATLLNAMFSK